MEASGANTDTSNVSQYAPQNTSVNFVQHKRFDDALINPDHMIKPRMPTNKLNKNTVNQPVVGDAPRHELLADSSTTATTTKHFISNKESKKATNPGAKKAVKRPSSGGGGGGRT